MKNIVLIRHGKSSWEHNVSDRERPLKSRGVNDAELVVNQLIKENTSPEIIFLVLQIEHIVRVKYLQKALKFPENKIIIVEELYDFGGENVINFIKKFIK